MKKGLGKVRYRPSLRLLDLACILLIYLNHILSYMRLPSRRTLAEQMRGFDATRLGFHLAAFQSNFRPSFLNGNAFAKVMHVSNLRFFNVRFP